MTCATKGCNFGVFRDHLCAPCYHRAEQQREDLIRRKAAAFDAIEAAGKSGIHIEESPQNRQEFTAWGDYRWMVDVGQARLVFGDSLLDAIEAMEEKP